MKAAVIEKAGAGPVYGEFREPVASEGQVVVRVSASALTHLSKGRASGAHYSAEGVYPSVPGVEGVGRTEDGRRVYFVMPEAPFGGYAEKSLARTKLCLPVPEGLSDAQAAALANPGMSAWAAMVERAHLAAGETVLVNGATGTAGRLAVQLAKHLGAKRVIATGRNEAELEKLKGLGADAVIRLELGEEAGSKALEEQLIGEFSQGIDVVVDYLWGESARVGLVAIAKGVEDGHPVRFVQVGSASGEGEIALPAAALRSSAVQLMGSGLKSVPMAMLLGSIGKVFEAAGPAGFEVEVREVPLADVAEVWNEAEGARVVFRME